MPNRCLMLLVPLVLMVFAQPLVAEGHLPAIVDKILGLLVLAGTFRIFEGDRKLQVIIIGLFVIAAVAIPLHEFTPGRTALIVGVLAEITAMTMTIIYIAVEALHDERVSRDTVMGAAAVYLLIGIGLAEVFQLTEAVSPGAFSNLAGHTAGQVQAELLYYSLVTLTTLGYGDIVPVLPLARTMAVAEAILGQFFVAAVIGLLISRQSTQLNVGKLSKASPAKPMEGT